MCLCAVGTLTQAMQIQRILMAALIETEIVKGDGDEGRGCMYALRYSCDREGEVRRMLRNTDARIRFLRR